MAAFASPYIKTEASQVTRVADSAVMTGVNFSSWYRADEGAFFVEAYGAVAGHYVLSANDTTDNNAIRFINGTASQFGVILSGATQASIDAGNPSLTSFNKYGASYKVNDFAVSLDGGAVATDTLGNVPIVTRLQIGVQGTSFPLNGYIKRITYYNQALTSANLQAVTR
jgi:hypothetical protein